MDQFNAFFLFGLLFLLFWSVSTYNRFVKFRNMIEEGWSIIDVALKRRANLVPKLIAAVEGYSAHEVNVLESITARRVDAQSNKSRSKVGESESQVSRSLGNLIAVAESNPDLKASQTFHELQQTLNEVEAEIAGARNQFNQRVRSMNTLVEQFPSNIIASIFKFRRDSYFQIELATERDIPSTPWDE